MGMQSLNSHSFLHFSSEAAEKTKGENSLNSFIHLLLFLAMVTTNKGEPLILRGQRQRHILVAKVSCFPLLARNIPVGTAIYGDGFGLLIAAG
ncbi:hypothetical protein Lalb_Chr21g0314821 [Lupinus albus]|uniref:Uncharacterized protein n=1 Tax=Lupinus albus TaxID=3870 RepID=A0A6A4NDD4_LUPAL|nr:hypothetical protein Lalb_Chr21g0314821 [Lupinus albus]